MVALEIMDIDYRAIYEAHQKNRTKKDQSKDKK
jgi:hypothetical protein